MDVKIYEERTGWMIFPIIPGKTPEKDENIIDLFNNHIDLYIEKKASELRISCYVSIQQSPKESKGYYVRSLSKYEDDSFTEFKKESNKALRTLGLQRNPGDANNLMFYNIEKLDLDIYLHEDTETVAQVLKSGEFLEYQAGNIDEITIFCKDIMKNIDNSKIAISSDVSKLGDINILSTKKHEESLHPNERTKVLLEKYRKDFINRKRKEEEYLSKIRISDGIKLIKEGLTILRSAGHEPIDISQEIDKITEEISASNKIKYKDDNNPVDSEKIVSGKIAYPDNVMIPDNIAANPGKNSGRIVIPDNIVNLGKIVNPDNIVNQVDKVAIPEKVVILDNVVNLGKIVNPDIVNQVDKVAIPEKVVIPDKRKNRNKLILTIIIYLIIIVALILYSKYGSINFR